MLSVRSSQECLGAFKVKMQVSFSFSFQATAPQSDLNTFCMGSLPAAWWYPDSSSIKRGVMLVLDHTLVAHDLHNDWSCELRPWFELWARVSFRWHKESSGSSSCCCTGHGRAGSDLPGHQVRGSDLSLNCACQWWRTMSKLAQSSLAQEVSISWKSCFGA